jgi:hypothetical protein
MRQTFASLQQEVEAKRRKLDRLLHQLQLNRAELGDAEKVWRDKCKKSVKVRINHEK